GLMNCRPSVITRSPASQVIEQQLNGIDNLRYVASDSNSDGSMTIPATFNQGTNPQNRQAWRYPRP
ncbi:MAG TPA: hypothetical protein ENI30_00865, partial [Gammaproteobacteria bacterium]|nr:hypothetical protein [Gammaproteobacteria bacterium]